MNRLRRLLAWFKPDQSTEIPDKDKADLLLKSFPKCC